MIQDLITDLLIDNPFYGYLAAKVLLRPDDATERMTTVFNGGPILLYNETWFYALSPAHQRGVLKHELLHLALLHAHRREGRKAALWHLACDIAVNELTPEKERLDDLITLQRLFRTTGLLLPGKSTAEVYYSQLMKHPDAFTFNDTAQSTYVDFASGAPCYLGPLEDMPKNDLMVQALIEELTTIQVTTQKENSLPTGLSEKTEALYSPYKINWRGVMKRFLSGQGRILTRKSYKRQSRRYDDFPGKKRSVGVRALVAVDESGSISNAQVAGFYDELLKINGINHADITAVSFDSGCSDPMPLSKFVADSGRKRRGGTDFRPVFDVADRLKLPLVILFTDGDGTAPVSVNQRVLWVLTEGGRPPADYGIAIHYREDYS